jgi:hypothetical protein
MESKLSHRHVPIEDGIQLNYNMNEPGSQSQFDRLIIDLDSPDLTSSLNESVALHSKPCNAITTLKFFCCRLCRVL